MKYSFLKTLLALSLFASLTLQLTAQKWEVPAEKKGKAATFKFTAESIKKGEAVFKKNCQSCHGNPGKMNFANIKPSPGDPATDKFQKQTDGELFYKISTGRSPMPQFKNILSDDERWYVISFFRSFNKNYIQPDPVKAAAFNGKSIILAMNYLEKERKLLVTATEKEKEISKPVQGVDISLYVKRYFGNMQVDESKTTNEKGQVTFLVSGEIPGDKTGKLDLIAKANETDKIPGAEADLLLAIGKPTNNKSLIATRDWWTVRSQAPVWLIILYAGAVLIVWGFIFYIVGQVLKIRKLNNQTK